MAIDRIPHGQTLTRQLTWNTGVLGLIDCVTSTEVANAVETTVMPSGEEISTGRRTASDVTITVMAADTVAVGKLMQLQRWAAAGNELGNILGSTLIYYSQDGSPAAQVLIERAHVKQITEPATDLSAGEAAQFAAVVSVFNPQRLPGT